MAPMEVWCRLETVGGRVIRVHVMHPNGEILASYPPEKFEAAVLDRMRAGQIRARVSPDPDGAGTLLVLEDVSGSVVLEDRTP